MESRKLIEEVLAGDRKAFEALVHQYQNVALGFAFSKLGDFHLAEDVVQESFLIAYQKMRNLEEIDSFSSWLRGIVNYRCHRVFRMKLRTWDAIDQSGFEKAADADQHRDLEQLQERRLLEQAILRLPELQRTAVALFYLEDQSQKFISDFLDLPVSKVNNLLADARKRLNRRLFNMAKDHFRERRLEENFAKSIGEVVGIEGPIVDTQLDKNEQTCVFDVLGSKTSNHNKGPEMVVVQRLEKNRFRCMTNGSRISQKDKLYAYGDYHSALKSFTDDQVKATINAMSPKTLEKKQVVTGIKVIDLLCPIMNYGNLGIFGKEGVGRLVFLMELIARKDKIGSDLSIFFFVDGWNALGTQDLLQTEKCLASDFHDKLQIAWMVHPKAASYAFAEQAEFLETRLYFSPLKAMDGLWPAIDPIYCHTFEEQRMHLSTRHQEAAQGVIGALKLTRQKLLDDSYLEKLVLGDGELASQERQVSMAKKLDRLPDDEKVLVKRGLLLERYLTQPFFVAENHTGRKGEFVPLEETIRDCQSILNGDLDDRKLDELMWKGQLQSN
ncbi:sigma-70 family RNA polymerase sigma factor [Pseudobacteriovorax antillogorgiicola]|uniref:RNA polymerase sigma factor n=1 Tax=Pseudobacteriovorax antillogorgiicola TaxID=1513793 RepID=A0A1Y6CH45_9BACT|nr:sigma-70 family RNA polymerase sigma factor [Pseudobacteriovorax antillogorgiicola]TCS47285.1 RNA polymerase sigma factor (sigma-70 family) [Pseudobacteriovorax antillogorgiicola]SMF62331.1 RNA polymerase sigma factor, sigma-70 family [Pseudobacteriovorax antillogorgiicola]